MNLAILAILVPGGLKNGILTADRKTKKCKMRFQGQNSDFQTFNSKFYSFKGNRREF